MALRKTPLITGQTYHIFNRGIDRRTTFITEHDYRRASECIKYYIFKSPRVRLSQFLEFSEKRQRETLHPKATKLVSIVCYCLMPNHFHFLLRQETDGGISKFIGLFLNSYTKYFNTKNKRVGALFLDQFKNVLIETDEQLVHVSRYIHLNPLTSFLVSTSSDLLRYKWSSLAEYITQGDSELSSTELILSHFQSKQEYLDFILDNKDYQRQLKKIQHLLSEE